MRKLIIILFFVSGLLSLKAQQLTAFSHAFYNPMAFNPAFAGYSGYYNAMIIGRKQWSGFTGAPQLSMLLADGTFKNKNMGLGLGVVNDKKGINNSMGGNVAYSYRLKLNEETFLLFGVSAGVISQSFDFSKINVENVTDPSLTFTSQKKITYDVNAGLAVVWKTLDVGLSVPQLAASKLAFKSDSAQNFTYAQERHFMGYAKYRYYIDKEKGMAIVPQAIIRIVPNAPLQYDGGLTFDWQDKFWVGAMYKSDYAVAANVGVGIKKHFYVGYSYDIAIGSIAKYAGMTHEILLHYKFGSGRVEEKKEKSSEEKDVTEKEENKPEVKEEPKKEAEPKVAEEETDTTKYEPLGDLTSLLVLNLIKEIEAILDNPNATPLQILDLKNRISAFSNSDFVDAAMKGRVTQYTEKLKMPDQTSPDIIVKGSIVMEGAAEPNYSMVSITVVDKKNEETVGTYLPNAKTGRFILILRPDEKYQIIVESDDYQIHTSDLSYPSNSDIKEYDMQVRLKK